ncbi:cytochrome P450 [Coniochaeta sp. 2T2.1]|nr:cytochrome P450 [Coniochaeta sp. 2T2.1]
MDFITKPTVLGPVAVLLGWLAYQLFGPSNLPKLTVLGLGKGEWFPRIQAAWRNTMDFEGALEVAYTQHRNEPVIVPLLTGTYVLLPASDTEFVAAAPDAQLSAHKYMLENFQLETTVVDPDIVRRPIHHQLVNTTLTSQTGNLVPDILDEAAWGFDQCWGIDTEEWKEVPLFETMRRVVCGITNRAFVGLPVCRDEELVASSLKYALSVPLSSILLKLLPRITKPFLVPLITLPGRIWTNQYTNILRPTIERRLKDFDARRADPQANKSLGPVPNDYLQWSIAQAKDLRQPDLYTPRKLAHRILFLNLPSIHTTSVNITSTILDLICRNKPEYIEEIRAEILSVLAEHGGEWNKRSLAKMHKLDSTLREGGRFTPTVSLSRKVNRPSGVDLPSGVHVPYGATVMVPGQSIMLDNAIYGPDAAEFKPFRFADEESRKAYVRTSKDFLPFGHGKYACPGRFFAATELKVMLG